MAEYIDREKMLKYLEENNTADEWIVGQYNADWIYSFIESQPTADVEKVKHGEWIDDGDCFHCSVCNKTYNLGSLQTIYDVKRCWKYCANCGAKMDGKDTNAPTK